MENPAGIFFENGESGWALRDMIF